ncbi:PKD domain-containing protein [Dyadobacter sp. CY323]|uniref:PKD domain-containing protein n=1 Tax=Dyadobacter sp. CY323 TaxID=2907302 RepID=UPI001F1D68DB|nr:right-handed parallel beta-helix repeat-containing protein [Dyadobacter sp. CY323]MCE6992661.1 right-handed parallel beta-helix repeat-containing protein [Dyadobacter sp. CY323]
MKIKFFTIAVSTSLLSLLVACNEDEAPAPAPPVQTTIKADAGTDQDILPNQMVTLDGTASKGADAKTFSWTLIKKPSNSNITLSQTSTSKPTFTPDIVGYYEMELTVSSGTEKSTDRVQVKAEYPTPIIIEQDIKSDTRLFDRIIDPTKPDYIVKKDIAVYSALSIDRGVAVAFERDKALNIEEKGSVVADGVAEQRIRFTGMELQAGFWAGIKLFSPSTANSLAFTDIEFAGSRIAFTNTKAGLALFGNNKAQLAITDSKFTSNGGYGLYVQNGSVLRKFERNAFSKQVEAPMLIDAYNATLLDAASKFTGNNGRDAVEINSSDIRGTQEVSWPSFADKTPYRLLGNMAVEAGWSLKPGVTVEVARDAMISINRNGYLSAKGTKENKVTIKGSSQNAAHWKGLIIYSVSALNELDHTEIIGAGSAVIVSGQRSAVTTYGRGAKLMVKNSKITKSGGYGIMYTSDAELNSDAATTNTFESNAQSDLHKL